MDLSVPSRYTDATVTVWSTQARSTTNTNLGVVPRVKLLLYTVDLDSGNRTQVGSSYTTDNNGQYTFTGLPYGLYVAGAESMGQYAEQSFAAYQQISSDRHVLEPTDTLAHPDAKADRDPQARQHRQRDVFRRVLRDTGLRGCSGTDRAAGRSAVPEESLNRLPSAYFSFSVRIRS